MNIDDLTLGQVKELRAMSSLQAAPQSSIYSNLVGNYVIVRSRNEGVNAGTVKIADETGIVLTNARRLWRHRPANQNEGGAWYESVALHGLAPDYTRISEAVPEKGIVENYSFTICTTAAKSSIEGFENG